jgi:broad specificity phosphatase PhoE
VELILVRHGESTANVAREAAEAAGDEVIDVGFRDADVPLSALGIAQCEALGRWLAGPGNEWRPDAAWSSPYQRARQTATTVLGAAGLTLPIRVDERLRDKELGVLDTLTSFGVRARFPLEAERRRWIGKFYYRAPGGESWADVALRLRSVLFDIERLESDRRVLVATHDAVVLLFRYICERWSEDQVLATARAGLTGNTAVTRLVSDGRGNWQAMDVNVQDHLITADGDLRTEHSAAPPAVQR